MKTVKVVRLGWLYLSLIVAISGCETMPSNHIILAKSEHTTVVISGTKDTWESLAETYYGDSKFGWYIADRNSRKVLTANQNITIPKLMPVHFGIFDDFEQTIPILTYHNFGPKKSKTTIRAQDFQQQLKYLRDNHYRVISLETLSKHMQVGLPIPCRAVVITIDDGFRSTYKIAFPLLKKYNIPATVFVYSDFINNGGLKRKQLVEMQKSGLIDIHSHSKTHRNFNRLNENESLEEFYAHLKQEVYEPKDKLSRILTPQQERYFAYPYGEVNPKVIEYLSESKHTLGLTVSSSTVNSYSSPFTLSRFQVFGNRDLQSFINIIERNRSELAP